MKLLLLNYEFPPLGAGAGNATKAMAREFVNLGHQVSVVTTWYPGLLDTEEVDGYMVYRVRSRRRRKDRSHVFEMFHYVLLAYRLVMRMVREDRPDHVIAYFALPTGLIAWRLFRRFGIPYTLSLRGGDVPGFLSKDLWLHHLLTRPLNGPVWGNAAHIVANSDGLQELAQKTARTYGKEVVCIPNGVDTNLYHPDPNRHRIEQSDLSLLFVGRFVRQKGVTYILQALEEVCRIEPTLRPRLHLTVVGDGPLREGLHEEAHARGVADMVTWKGWFADRTQLAQEYRRHDVFVFPSFEEGMPNAVLEAMASGLAIVATDIGGTNTLVLHERQGLLVRGHSTLFAPALIRLSMSPDQLSLFKREAREQAQRFGWDTVARAYISLLA